MNETLPKTQLTEEVERDSSKNRGDEPYAQIAEEIATTITSGKARLCTVADVNLIHWQSYIRYHLGKKGLKLIYRRHGVDLVRAWAEPKEKKVSSK